MNEQDKLIQNVKKWVELENNISSLQKVIKQKKKEKKNVSNILVEIMRMNEIDCFNMNDKKLIYTRKTIKKPLSKKHLITSLITYFGGKKEDATTLSSFILNSRDDKIIENIRIKK
tara:strand:- start:105 stop:452 length:348 start_codon:yes stop_codon:yes gene_type:complete